MTTLTANMTVGRIAVEHPGSTRTFARHGIDFCCGGEKSLAVVSEELGLDPEVLLGELREDIAWPPVPEKRWDHAPTEDLIEHILTAYHDPLREELPRLEALARKVLRVHGHKAAHTLSGVLSTLLALQDELIAHMLKEERILFPLLRMGQNKSARGPLRVMRHEHKNAGAALAHLRELTDDYEAPAGACTTWRALWHGLKTLEASLHAHIHLENNALFPRAEAAAEPPLSHPGVNR